MFIECKRYILVRKIKIEKRCKKKKMKQRRFTNKKLIALMLPLAVDQLLNSFMGTVDTLVVSNLGSAAISAVSLVDSINILVVQAFFALASGGTVVCSHYLGCEKKERATNAARQLVFITFAMSLVIAIACHLFSNQLLGVILGRWNQRLWTMRRSTSSFRPCLIHLSHCTMTEPAF